MPAAPVSPTNQPGGQTSPGSAIRGSEAGSHLAVDVRQIGVMS